MPASVATCTRSRRSILDGASNDRQTTLRRRSPSGFAAFTTRAPAHVFFLLSAKGPLAATN
ncbi:MAG: hypothetical protein JWR01_223 [Subtercola sp.]|nr:hypothetical protein [Subtercola sp.]